MRPAATRASWLEFAQKYLDVKWPHAAAKSRDAMTDALATVTAANWSAARPAALLPAQVESPLAGRPYDLRHAAVSLWLNAGVPATEVAARAGHGVDVLLRVYASCIDGSEAVANERIDAAPDL